MDFPLYRKYPNNKSIFKIISESHFIELQQLGSKYMKSEIEAKILPDRVLIQDMIDLKDGHWVEASELDFMEFEKSVIQ